ncbi:hypothetical protein CC117_02680 [Parafrankia colletiae]|uniref:Uncharacterized protein n=1 Tax=Parafrankia colletiae TaxID=573497 RepID=A0A1S1QZG9_9ACTN|nr:hypothetical protein [Parafrankia colletiae]MCK9899100.1 hypothetical protein [Frankia sp. Cpl3]OHV38665.1 hypothetical protein CC117_02680 [Parafrankia colletiae]
MSADQARPHGVDVVRDRSRPAVVMLPWGAGTWAVVIQPGSDLADLHRALAEMPAGLEFHSVHGDGDVILVYQVPAGQVSRRDLLRLTGSALDIPTGFPDRSRWITREEQQAYRAGHADAFEAIRVFLSRPTGGTPDEAGPGSADSRGVNRA